MTLSESVFVVQHPHASRKGLSARGLRSLILPALAGTLATMVSLSNAQVTAHVTADNLYMLGWGNSGAITNMHPTPPSVHCSAADIFSCGPGGVESYTLTSLTANSYLYLVAWSDDAVSQGIIAQFVHNPSGNTLYTGGGWEVFATGIDYDPTCNPNPPAPTLAQVNAQIALANSVAGGPAATTSQHWVNTSGGVNGPGFGVLAVGEPNTAGGVFPAMACLNPAATWMWYTTDPTYTTIPNPFSGAGNMREYLIFRKPLNNFIPCTPCPCPAPTTICYDGGRDDALASPNDPAFPRPALLTWATNVGAPLAAFDEPASDRRFIHTFSNIPNCICSATLTIKMRANSSLATNDGIALQYNGTGVGGTFTWGSAVQNLPGVSGTWTTGNTATVTLDLCNLRNADGTFTNLVDAIKATGHLDVTFQDDTTIDSMKLTVRACPPQGNWSTYIAGSIDNFNPALPIGSLPDPAAWRQPSLTALRTTPGFLWKGFDSCALDVGMGHTFNVPPGVVSGILDTQLAPCMPNLGTGDSNNDGIAFDLKPGSPAAFGYSYFIRTAPGQIFPGTWNTTQNLSQFFTFNIGSIFPGGCPNILGGMADGKFDVYVQDDSNVDFYRLRVQTCPPPRRFWGISLGDIGIATIDPGFPGVIAVRDFGTIEDAGILIDASGTQGVCVAFESAPLISTGEGGSLRFETHGGSSDEVGVIFESRFEVSDGRSSLLRCAAPGTEGQELIYTVSDESGDLLTLSSLEPVSLSSPVQGSQLPQLNIMDPHLVQDDRNYTGHHFRFSGDVLFNLGGQTVIGTKIKIRKGGEDMDHPIASLQIKGEGYNELLIGGVALQQFGRLHHGVGNGHLMLGPGLMGVENIGSSGNDGIAIYAGKADAISASLTTNLMPGEAIPDGSVLRASFIGSHGGVPDLELGYLSCMLDELAARWIIEADYTPIGATLRTVQILRDGELVAEIPDVSGPIGYAAELNPTDADYKLPPSCGKGAVALNGQRVACGRIRWPKLKDLIISGRAPIQGDEIRVLAQNATAPFDYVQRMDITASGFPNFVIYGEEYLPFGGEPSPCSPCAADFNQDGGIDGSDIAAFFESFEAGGACGDVNQDGGIDGSDIAAFFEVFEQGGC